MRRELLLLLLLRRRRRRRRLLEAPMPMVRPLLLLLEAPTEENQANLRVALLATPRARA
jgi:hypothetical protein